MPDNDTETYRTQDPAPDIQKQDTQNHDPSQQDHPVTQPTDPSHPITPEPPVSPPEENSGKKIKLKKNRKIIAITCAAILALGGACLYTDFVMTRTATKIEEAKGQEDKIVNDVLSYLSTTHTSDEIEQAMLKALKTLPAKRCTSLVDTYLYAVYNTAAQYSLNDDQTNKLYAAMNMDGSFDMSLVDDEELKKQVEELGEQHIVLKFLNGSLFWDTDYSYFDKTFGEYVNPDYRDMIHFYAEEKSNSYCDEDGEKLYLKIVTKRLDTLFDMMATYPDSEIYDIMKESYYFYKAVYLGAYAQDYIFDNGSIRPEILESYKEYMETCKDSELKEFMQKLIKSYEEVNNVRTVPVYEMIKDFCGLYETNKNS